jgi:serine/threonine protein kinase
LKDVVDGIVRVKNFFRFRKSSHHPDQYCIIFERLGSSLYQYLEENEYRGYHLKTIQNITRQVLKCLKDLSEKKKLVHTDLKPENILFVKDRSWEIDRIEDLPLQVNDANDRIKCRKKRDGTFTF